jgi:probable rRNA maturation factor
MLDVPCFRRLVRSLLDKELNLADYSLAINFVDAISITRLNETWLRHGGSTDVITFDYRDPANPGFLAGEVFVCVEEAVRQAARFKTTWRREIARYLIHGVLHLCGYDDQTAVARRKMKREENRLLARLFPKDLTRPFAPRTA